jgi:hypothetical protein
MEISLRTAGRLTALGSALLLGVSFASAGPRSNNVEPVTQDGLHRIDDTPFAGAWSKPGIDLRGYDKILLQPFGIQFREVKDPGFRRDAGDFPLDDEQKRKLEETIREALVAELAKSERFTLTDQPGPGVLAARGAFLDVVSHVPPDPIGRGATFVRSLGEATLVVELRDSLTDELYARAVDRRAVEPPIPTRSNAVNNRAEVRRAVRRWAAVLREQLDELVAA